MRIDIISAVPSLLTSPFSDSILKRAQNKGLVEVVVHDLRDYTTNKHKKIDDYAFGGGAGMVMTIQPIDACITELKSQRVYDEVIYMTPDGEQLNQQICNKLSSITNIIVLCGHYKGIDERVRKMFITREISIGDYVLSGGELGAAVLADSIIRLIPGVLNDETSALTDSFKIIYCLLQYTLDQQIIMERKCQKYLLREMRELLKNGECNRRLNEQKNAGLIY